MTPPRSTVAAVVVITSLLCLDAAANAQTLGSAQAAQDLIKALGDAKLETIAAPDPSEPGTFVAALHIPGTQLLVVRARHTAGDALTARLTAHQYREVYLDLQATPTPKGKWFIMDSGADGLADSPKDSSAVDIVYEDGARQTMFNGAKAAKLSAKAYQHKLTTADATYVRVLKALTAAAEASKHD